ncbi:MAG: ATP-binding protein [Spirochaetia bacterium]
MRGRLLVKLLAAMGVVVLIGSLASAIIIGITTQKAFKALVRENDRALSQTIASSFEEYYRQNGRWEDVEKLLEDSGSLLHSPRRMMGSGTGMMGQNGRMPMQERGSEENPFRIVLTDEDGTVVAHSLDNFSRKTVGDQVLQEGTPLVVDGRTAGYLFVGTMVEPAFGPFQRQFISNVYRSIALSTLLVAFVAIGAAALVFRNIIHPLESLTEATKQMSRGDYAINIDTTRTDEIGKLSNSFHSMAEALREADEWKRRLITDSAHELRTPVALLQGNLEMMREGVYPADNEHLDRLYEETLLLARLVSELRTLADAEAGSSSYDFRRMSLGEVVSHLVAAFRVEASSKNIHLKLDTRGEDFTVYGDRYKLEQAVSNIFSNALRYTPKDGTVIVELFKEDKTICTALEDSGPGIAVEERDKVFERFYRTDLGRNRSDGGSGLGLPVAQQIVKMHGGDIRIEEPIKLTGARFVLSVPWIKSEY